jgi:5S rRNA maturation endonuclease (ribonuclease M5)
MLVTEKEIYEIKEFIDSLNSEKGSAVIVEGKRDSAALKNLGFTEKVLEFHRFGGLTKFADSVYDHKNLIVLFDSDRKGRYLTRRVIEQLEHRTKIDLSYKKKLVQITRGKIRAIEDLGRYEQFLYCVADFSY